MKKQLAHRVARTAVAVALAVSTWSGTAAAAPTLRDFPPGTPVGALPFAVAWGDNQLGGIGDGTDIERHTPAVVNGGDLLDEREIDAISMGEEGSCAISVGVLSCWGPNDAGQLGNNTFTTSYSPVAVAGPLTGRRVSQVSTGGAHTCAIAEGKAYCWGYNEYGQLGDHTLTTRKIPTLVGGALTGRTVTAITTGAGHTCAVANGAAYCWGFNDHGELGNNKTTNSSLPVQVQLPESVKKLPVTSISAGWFHSCALVSGQIFCWGDNFEGQLGTGNHQDSSSPMPTPVDSPLRSLTVESLSTGGSTSCVTAGSRGGIRQAYCWGSNDYGQVGDGTLIERTLPVAVATAGGTLDGKSVSSISVDLSSGCLVADGQGYCWGRNSWGQLGNNTLKDTAYPAAVNTAGVLAGKRLATISSGKYHIGAVAITAPGFNDVSSNHPLYDDISWITGTGVAQGYPDHTFKPTSSNQRQAMAAYLYRSGHLGAGIPDCNPDAPRLFNDVPTDNPFCGAIEWMVSAKITAVPFDKKFHPGDAITRDVMATFLYRSQVPGLADQTCTGPTRLFKDVDAANPYCGNIEWLATAGVTTGYTGGKYQPGSPVAREAMAAFLHRVQELTAH